MTLTKGSDGVSFARGIIPLYKIPLNQGRSKVRWFFLQMRRFFPIIVLKNPSFPMMEGPKIRRRAEYGFGEYGFKHRTQWVFWGSLSSRERTQWVPLGLLFVCQQRTHRVCRRTHQVCRRTQWGSVSSLLRNSTLKTVFRPFPKNQH